MNKYVILGIFLVALLVGGLVFYMDREKVSEDFIGDEQTTVAEIKGEVISVDLSQMMLDGPAVIKGISENSEEFEVAIPSMGLPLCVAVDNIADVSMVAVGDKIEVLGNKNEQGQIIPCDDKNHYFNVTGVMMDEAFGFWFEYRKGPDGYVTIENNESLHEDFVTGINLFNKKEYEEFQNSLDAREGPTSMGLRVYQNPQKKFASVWAMENSGETNISLALGESNEAVVGGANAEHFIADGLYPIDTYVVASGEHIYVLTGSYLDQKDSIYNDFQKLVSSFTFIPTVNNLPQGKIDVKTACESALAYMSFMNGEEAEAFVEACINGEHPEVIERYVEDMGWDGRSI